MIYKKFLNLRLLTFINTFKGSFMIILSFLDIFSIEIKKTQGIVGLELIISFPQFPRKREHFLVTSDSSCVFLHILQDDTQLVIHQKFSLMVVCFRTEVFTVVELPDSFFGYSVESSKNTEDLVSQFQKMSIMGFKTQVDYHVHLYTDFGEVFLFLYFAQN